MKKTLLSVLIGIAANLSFAQTATDFTVNDCAGSSHHLFAELDAGTVIVLTWVMPCSQCIPGAATAAATSKKYSTSYPDRVKFYLVDDPTGGYVCSTLTSWATN